ncbi:2-amino-4-hydroxy-6-hydroxymethyldihydropteridine diphosphokinase [Rhodohalobacter halophilus]|uniref:2-amino-4-hydroxy-6- hydroxymethyldihydropteridine diphosphokinase n=1 Tax=Rhodohalobacter halophilus TaxID=1812810 RepID=UPI00083FBA96|nr:2-amino-4-hydroxy-6-hydroxymethyldihydropteridine diphosphokinase [Rhodohalobacter halophilus]
MEQVIVAIGANLGDRLKSFQKAAHFLSELSDSPIKLASIWESEPVGPAKYTFLNSAIQITTDLSPGRLLKKLKEFEKLAGRTESTRWGPRILDLDIISYGNLVIDNDTLIIPHPEYQRRLFVLLPMQELIPDWCDPQTGKTIQDLIESAPGMEIKKTDISW